ncbi:hypothetical protein DSCO28_50940 [Desulfosarcina ovata subsp. sediminis]|uniref:Uncharacterized protein n=1 Tax=Desulfosarcina ovata subsp. sediminis TaxID=885957 RepID=A0A5K7ZWC5_9BACT|nr:hypothetical protein [Desulfosarcina ovata]BBO84528.1 hypothetical protein DSCO28_50940 [Desulfosarcina ovata subsp. sediminis]
MKLKCFPYLCVAAVIVVASASLMHPAMAATPLFMQTVTINDPQMGGIPAFRVLAPADWRPSGGLTWNIALANLVTADVAITAADGSAGLFVHPGRLFISGQIEYQWQRGQPYLGMIVMPIPDSPAAFVQQIVLPEQRPGARNLRLISQKDLPEWANSIAAANQQPGGITRGYGTRARFSYTENGVAWEEDFYCVVLVFKPQMGPPTLLWQPDRNLSVRARKGRLDALDPLANAFVNSFRVDRSWFARFTKVQQQWIAARQQGIANAGALSRAISRSNDAFDNALAQSWKTRQQAEDRASREFSEYIRGTENYNDPSSGNPVELPGGYDHAWGNSLGEYVLSNDSGFDPNQHSSTDWVAIEPVR